MIKERSFGCVVHCISSGSWLLSTGVAVSLMLCGTAAAQTDPGTGAGFEIYGRLLSGSAPAGFQPGDGWAQGSGFLGVLDADGNAVPPSNAKRQLDENWGSQGAGIDPTRFIGSNKNDDLIGPGQNPWAWGAASGGPQKNDITNTYFHARIDPDTGHRWVFIAAETRSTSGDSHVDFEFNQAGVQQVGTTSGQLIGNGPEGGRTVGDFIVSVDFLVGGESPSTTIRIWNGSAFVDMPIPEGALLSASNLEDIAHGAAGTWKHFDSNGGTVEVLSALQLVEAGVDLTALGIVVDECSTTATFTVKTRASSSFTGTLKDFVLVPFPILPTPQASAANSGPACAGDPVQLFAGPDGFSYTWSGPGGYSSNEQNPLLSPAVAGEYCVTVSNAGGCSETACTQVLVTPLPEASAANSGPVCAGDAVQLFAGPDGQSYAWTGPGGFSSSEQNPVVSSAVAGEYCVTVSDAAGCSAAACTQVLVTPLPEASASNSGPVCAGDAVQLFAGPDGQSYAWTGPGGFSSSEQNPVVSPAVAGEYCVTVSDAAGCSAAACTQVVVTPLPEASAANSGPVCAGDAVQLFAGPDGQSYAWTGPGGFSSSEQNPIVSPAAAGEYCVTVSDAAGCSAAACTQVVVTPLPETTASNSGPVCAGDAVQLFAGPDGQSYAWTGPGGFASSEQNPIVSPAVAGEYCVTVSDAAGCSAAACTQVVVTPLPETTAANSGPVCAGDAVQLFAGPDGQSYAWTGAGGFASSEQNPIVSPAVAGEYCVTVSDAAGCSAAACTQVVVTPLPEATAANSGPVCPGDAVQLFAGPDGQSYAWMGPGGYTSNEQNPVASPAVAGEYCVTVNDAAGCAAVACTEVVIASPPEASAANSGPVCSGDDVQLFAGPHGLSYTWVGPGGFAASDQNPLVSPALAGVYCVTVTDEIGCADTACTEVLIGTAPVASAATSSGPVCEGFDVQLFSGPDGFTYSWTGPGGFESAEQNPLVSPAVPGDYCVSVADDLGCSDVACVEVVVNLNPICFIDGPDFVCAGSSCVVFGGPSGTAAVFGSSPPVRYNWIVEGDAEIVGPADQEMVVVDPGGAVQEAGTGGWGSRRIFSAGDVVGEFTLLLQTTSAEDCISECSLTVQIITCEGEELITCEGCSAGYWQQPQHLFNWPEPYDPADLFSETAGGDVVFEDAFANKTLLQVMQSHGGGLAALGRQTVAALLNGASPAVNYPLPPSVVITMFNDVYPGSNQDYALLKDQFEDFNKNGCPLGSFGSPAAAQDPDGSGG